ncbi:tripartite tricarboxylate transporter substrate binding protein [Paracoccus pacificus]|uniref:Tripartite tricarboxylate transporter substrate binding protein n=1 Tax=Paracoccus pacificus TaxID=1463598 RepID=A0ABW4RCM6_9RHOB
MFRAIVAAAVAAILVTPAAWAESPFNRPLTIIVPAGAGGGGDTTTRLLARELETELGQPITVINQGQGGGVVGLTSLKNAAPDGYTVGLLFPYAGYAMTGQADFKGTDFSPIGVFNGDSAAILVAKDSPFADLKSALDAMKADPSKYKIHCSGACGSVWDIPVAGMLLDYGVDVSKLIWVPGQGAASGLTELASGGVDFQTASLPEAAAMIAADAVRPLAVLSPNPVAGFEDVPLAGAVVGKPLDGGTWRALGGPAGMSPEMVKVWEDAMRKAVESPRFVEGMQQGNFGRRWLDATQLKALMDQHEADTKRIMTALGYGK